MTHSLVQLEAEALAVVHKLGVPPCPQVLSDVSRELRHGTPDVQKIAASITHDAVSSAAILKTVNSPYYGLMNKARSVHQAIAYLGLDRTAMLLAGLLLRNAFPSTNKRAMIGFWERSSQIAVMGAFLARQLPAIDRDEAHTFGLFRDVGSAVLISKFDGYEKVVSLAQGSPAARLTALEKERFGTDHAVIGAVLAKDWLLPEEMSEAILWHHADFVFDLSERPISDEALRLVALGLLSDVLIDEYSGMACEAWACKRQFDACRVLELPDTMFDELKAEAMILLDQLNGHPATTMRMHTIAR
jgi:HD-like signal output (HDOD) protein